MKKIVITTIAIIILVVSCVASFYAGYHYVIHNQYYEECEHYDNCYHIIIDGNIHEYEYAE